MEVGAYLFCILGSRIYIPGTELSLLFDFFGGGV